MAIASGIAFIADGSAGIQVVNYLPFDNKGQAPTLSISSTVADLDPNTAGVQILEGTTIPIQANVQDDVQVRNVELLVNGAVVQNDVSFPFDLSAIAPNITDQSSTVTVQVRATDTGGNITLSDPLTFNLVPDTFAPTIDSVSVGEGEQVLKSFSVRVVADKSLDAATVTQATFELLDPSGNEVTPHAIQLRRNDQVVQLDYQTLPPGDYELIIHSGLVTDRAGNPLATDVIRHFTVTTATTKWISPSGGDWSNPSNWFNDVVAGTDRRRADRCARVDRHDHAQRWHRLDPSLTSSEALVLSRH